MTSSQSAPRGAVAALVAAFLGWLFDGFEMGLFPLIGKPALQDMLPGDTQIVRDQGFTVIIAVFLVGAATGGVLFGWLGDKLGRVKAMTLAIFTYAILAVSVPSWIKHGSSQDCGLWLRSAWAVSGLSVWPW